MRSNVKVILVYYAL